MSVRALWILPVDKAAEQPLFTRYFPNVEMRCKLRTGKSYVKIPPENELVKLLLQEVAVIDGDVFLESRDSCNKQVLFPAFGLQTDSGILWPVVVIERKGLIYCAVPLEEENQRAYSGRHGVSLAEMPGIAVTLEVLSGLACCVSANNLAVSQGLFTSPHPLIEYLNVAIPFGRPVCCDTSVAHQLPKSAGKGKAKSAVWNPVAHKGKSQVVLCLKEEVRCMQFNHEAVQDSVNVYGCITCNAEVEGTAPEISLVLSHSAGSDGCGLIANPAMSNIENIGQMMSRLRFHPSDIQPLCHYSLPNMKEPPILGEFTVKMNDSSATVFLQLKLQSGVKNLFQQFEAHIPFLDNGIASARPHCSQGTVSIHSKNILVWVIGTKLPSKTLTAKLNAVVKLKKIQQQLHNMQDIPHVEQENYTVGSENPNSMFAMLLFKIADYTYSGTKLDPQSVVVSTAAKVRCSVSSEFTSSVYKIWNSEGEIPVLTHSMNE